MTGPAARTSAGERGFSLVELLVALTLGVTLSFGAVGLLLRSKVSYLQDEALAQIQENGRYALRYIARELTMAGHLGRAPGDAPLRAAPAGSACFTLLSATQRPLEHVDDVSAAGLGTPALPADCRVPDHHVPRTDILVIRRTADAAHVLDGRELLAREPGATYLRVDHARDATSLETGGGAPGPSVDIWEYTPQILFLRDFAIAEGDGVPTLCRRRLARSGHRMAPVQCLAEGIENLQVEFGVDEDGDRRADRFYARPTAAQLRAAVAARVFLLLRSVRKLHGFTDTSAYRLGGTRVAPPRDAYYRRVLHTTILLRNAGAAPW